MSLKIYPRGFIGPLLNNDNVSKVVRQIKIVQATFKIEQEGGDTISPDKDIQTLYKRYINNSSVISDNSFRENILIKAKQMFSLDGLIKHPKVWFTTQVDYTDMDSNHFDYLREILVFATDDRTMLNANTWARLLESKHSQVKDKSRCKDELVALLEKRSIEDIPSFIQAIVSKRGSYSSLLAILYTIYGAFEDSNHE